MNKILFIRRDNIGDLVCTTPAIRAVRLKFPQARIAVLVNSYNAGAVADNPDIDEVYVYEKEKHALSKGRLRVFMENLGVIRRIRKERFDAVVGCGYGYSARVARFACLTGAGHRAGFVSGKKPMSRFLYNLRAEEPQEAIHEVEAVMRLVALLGVSGPAPPLCVRPSEGEVKKVISHLKGLNPLRGQGYAGKAGLVVFHISSRKPKNRWPKESFRELGGMIQKATGAEILLLWSPGSFGNVLHPGDDEAAEWMSLSMDKRPFTFRTKSLAELIAAMSLASSVVCCDGGAMHIAAGLGKPIVTVWGTTERKRWAPWGVPHVILQKEDGLASAVNAKEAFDAFMDLTHREGSGR
ncbi:MAG: glycosyltransferase family 9 protein [Deltaproteobacteria bacterium]|nr:glycosyltransferase family 9 protein [Deltaproteobacteria bacterium]